MYNYRVPLAPRSGQSYQLSELPLLVRSTPNVLTALPRGVGTERGTIDGTAPRCTTRTPSDIRLSPLGHGGSGSLFAMLNVLDDIGYVRIPEEDGRPLVMGSDLSVVNAARASFAKESVEFGPNDHGLLKFLIREGHTSPMRHAFFTLEVKAPLMTARQWWKYVVGSDHTMDGWNEASRRYITMATEFYIPKWRTKGATSKQGSGDFTDEFTSQVYEYKLRKLLEQGVRGYEEALQDGLAPEQARAFLPANVLYTVWRWSGSLQSLCHMLQQRLAHDSQWEFQQYAQAVATLMKPHFPVTIQAMIEGTK